MPSQFRSTKYKLSFGLIFNKLEYSMKDKNRFISIIQNFRNVGTISIGKAYLEKLGCFLC